MYDPPANDESRFTIISNTFLATNSQEFRVQSPYNN
jgi:hypothetical protein